MNILYINQYGSREVGGGEGYIADVSAMLEEEGHHSHLIYFSSSPSDDLISTATYTPLGRWPSSIESTIQVIEKVIAEFRPDIAYIHTVYHPELLKWIIQRLPTVAYIHSPYLVCPGSAQYLRNTSQVCPHKAGLICLVNAQIERCCWGRNPIKHLRLLTRVHAYMEAYQSVGVALVGSKFMKQLLQRAGIPPEKIFILPPILIRKPVLPLTFAEDSTTILFAGRLVPEKGLRQVIEALALIESDWQLVVAGEGEEREPCQLLATRLGVGEKVHFVGWLNGSEMTAALQNCACVVLPSLWPEPFGRIGPEAFVHGRPVVGFATGGIPDWLKNDVSGYLVETGNISELGRKIQSLLDSPSLRLRMGRQARNKALSTWNASTHGEQLTQIFEDLQYHFYQNRGISAYVRD